MTQRLRRHPFLGLFDGADPNATTPERQATTVPTQALFFLNDPFVHDQADKFAARLVQAAPDDGVRIDLAHRILYGRPATLEETRTAEMYLKKYTQGLKDANVPPEKQAGGGVGQLFPCIVRGERIHICRLKKNFTAESRGEEDKRVRKRSALAPRALELSAVKSSDRGLTHERSAMSVLQYRDGTPCGYAFGGAGSLLAAGLLHELCAAGTASGVGRPARGRRRPHFPARARLGVIFLFHTGGEFRTSIPSIPSRSCFPRITVRP